MVEQAIQMALQPPAIYHKMQAVFAMYEEGTLKDQKKRVMSGSTLQMAIEGKLAPKLPQFKIFQGLKVISVKLASTSIIKHLQYILEYSYYRMWKRRRCLMS